MSDDLIEKMFPPGNPAGEYFMFAQECYKISRYNMNQKRILMLSNLSIYLLTETEARRAVPISLLKYIIKSLKGPELLLYFTNESDLRLVIEDDDARDEFAELLTMRFTAVCPAVHLKLFGVPDESLRKYKAVSSSGFTGEGYAFENEPEDKYRLRHLEVATEEEYKQETQTSTP